MQIIYDPVKNAMKNMPDQERTDDENPELTEEWFANARSAQELFSDLFTQKSIETLTVKTEISCPEQRF